MRWFHVKHRPQQGWVVSPVTHSAATTHPWWGTSPTWMERR